MTNLQNQRWPLFVLLCLTLTMASRTAAADLCNSYAWKPITLGAGGWVDGIIVSDSDPNVRFVRDDTGQAYRWDTAVSRWIPMVVQNDDGSGFGTAIIPSSFRGMYAMPASFALDPNDNKVLYLYVRFGGLWSRLPYNVYKSMDGGKNFTATKFNDIAGFTSKGEYGAQDTEMEWWRNNFRWDGERLAVDPNNSKVVYICTATKGLFKSADAGDTWVAMSGGGLPAPAGRKLKGDLAGTFTLPGGPDKVKDDYPLPGAHYLNVLPYKKGGTIAVNGVTLSKVIYLVTAQDHVYLSSDGGQNWINTTQGGVGPAGNCYGATLDQNTGALYVPTKTNLCVWKYSDGNWRPFKFTFRPASVAVDPCNSDQLVVMSDYGALSISTNAGNTWAYMKFSFSGTQAFAGTAHWTGRSSSKVLMDTKGTVWVVEGNDGVIRWPFDAHATNSCFTPDTLGVENFVAMDLSFPKNWGGKAVVTVMDEGALVVNNLDTGDVVPLCLNSWLVNESTISICPNDPNTCMLTGWCPCMTTNAFKTYRPKKNVREDKNFRLLPPNAVASAAWQISRRGDWSAGADHLVGFDRSVTNVAAWYSTDGGKTWAQSTTIFTKITHNGDAFRELVADPFTPDKFYVSFWTGGFWVTTDGGVTWTQRATPGSKPVDPKKGPESGGCWQKLGDNWAPYGYVLMANEAIKDDLWLETSIGLFHTTDGGLTWNEVLGNKNLHLNGISKMALGAGSGRPGDAPYTIYYVYSDSMGKDFTEPMDCGIYRSTNAGASWDRICKKYPAGLLYDGRGNTMAASWDIFGLVGMSCGGQGFLYGKLVK